MKKYGYARISHRSQNIQRQIESLTDYGVERIFQDVQSGRDDQRPSFKELMDIVKPGDVIVIHSLDRLMRSTVHLWKTVEELREKEVNLISLGDPWLDISGKDPNSEFMLTVMAGVAQLERQNTLIRQKEGIEIARHNPEVKFGRPKKTKTKVDYALKLYDEKEHTIKQIEDITGVSKATIYRRLKERDEE